MQDKQKQRKQNCKNFPGGKAEHLNLIVRTNPFDFDSSKIHEISYKRQRLIKLLEQYLPYQSDVFVRVNQKRLTKKQIRNYRVYPGDEIIMMPKAGDPFTIGSMLVTALLASAEIITWSTFFTMAIAVGAGYVINAFGPKPSKPKFDTFGAQKSNYYSWNPITTQKPGNPLPLCFGRNKLTGNIIAGWTDADGEIETLKMLISLGGTRGPVKGVVEGTHKIQDQPAENFKDVIIHERKDTFDQTAIFDCLKLPYYPELKVTNEDGQVIFSTPDNDFDKLEIVIEYQACNMTSGTYGNHSIGVKIEIAEHDSEIWLPLCNSSITDHNTIPKKKTFFNDKNYTGGNPVTIVNGKFYKVRLTKTTADKGDYYADDLKLITVKEVINEAYTYPGQHLIGIEALATNQLSGSFNYSCISDGLVIPVYNGQSWSIEYSANPAWIRYYLLTLPVISGDGSVENKYEVVRYDGLNPEYLEPYLSDFYEAAKFYDTPVFDGKGSFEPRIAFNGIFDWKTNVWDAISALDEMSRSETVPQGLGYTVLIDKKWEGVPIQMFNAANIVPDTYERPFITRDELSSTFELEFKNKDIDYKTDSIPDYNSGIGNYKKHSKINSIGITSAAQAWRHKMWLSKRNEIINSNCTFCAEIDAIGCKRGDVVYIVPSWREDGRIAEKASTNQCRLDKNEKYHSNYKLAIRTHDPVIGGDRVDVYDVIAVENDMITINGIFAVKPKMGDIYAYGKAEDILERWRINTILETEDLSFRITATEYYDELYNFDQQQPILPKAISLETISVPEIFRPVTIAEVEKRYPKRLFGGISYRRAIPSNLLLEGTGSIHWSNEDPEQPIIVFYDGIAYQIEPGSTNMTYVYWDPADNPNIFKVTDSKQDIINANAFMVAYEKDGIVYPGQFFNAAITGVVIDEVNVPESGNLKIADTPAISEDEFGVSWQDSDIAASRGALYDVLNNILERLEALES